MLRAEWQQDAQLTGKGLVITEPKLYRGFSNPDHLAGGIAQLATRKTKEDKRRLPITQRLAPVSRIALTGSVRTYAKASGGQATPF